MRRGRPGAAAHSGRAVDVHVVLGQDISHRPALGVREARDRRPGSSSPANAEEPNRLKPKREPSSSAQSTRTRGLRGDESPACARRTPTAAITPERPVEPAAVGDGVDVRADRQRRPRRRRRRGAPRGSRPRRARSRRRSPPGARRGMRAPRARSRSRRRAGRRPRPRCGAASSRRSAITRSASIRAGSVKPRGRAGWPAPGNALRRRRA